MGMINTKEINHFASNHRPVILTIGLQKNHVTTHQTQTSVSFLLPERVHISGQVWKYKATGGGLFEKYLIINIDNIQRKYAIRSRYGSNKNLTTGPDLQNIIKSDNDKGVPYDTLVCVCVCVVLCVYVYTPISVFCN